MNNYLPVMLLKGFVILPKQEVKLELNSENNLNVVTLSTNEYNNELTINDIKKNKILISMVCFYRC